jgi:hypothetical protein
MMMASFVRETRGRKAKLDAGPQQLSRVTTANKTTAVEKPFLWWSIILLDQITLQKIYSILNMQIRNKITSQKKTNYLKIDGSSNEMLSIYSI